MIWFVGTDPIFSYISILYFHDTIIAFENTSFFKMLFCTTKMLIFFSFCWKHFQFPSLVAWKGKSIHHFLVVSLNQTISVSFPSNITHNIHIFRFYNKKICMFNIWFYKQLCLVSKPYRKTLKLKPCKTNLSKSNNTFYNNQIPLITSVLYETLIFGK